MKWHRNSLSLAIIAASWLALPAPAVAHDPPQGTGVFVRGARVLIRTNRGLVLSENGTTGFKLLCNEALGINTAEIPALVPLDRGDWLIGSSRGVVLAGSDLCTLTPVPPLDMVAVPAVARDPNNPARIFASTGQANYDNGLYLSTDGAQTFAELGVRDQQRLYDRVVVSPANAQKLFASGLRIRADKTGFDYFFATSSDGGASFTEHVFALHPDEYALEVLGAHPTQAKTLFGVTHADLGTGAKDRLLVSANDGQDFVVALSVDVLTSFAIDPTDGALYAGARDGLWRSTNAGKTFTRIQSEAVHCLACTASTLYICTDQDGAAGLSVSKDHGDTLTRVMSFTDVTAMVSCAADAPTRVACVMPWYDWTRELSAGFVLDAGAGVKDASPANDGAVTGTGDASASGANPARSGGCSCTSMGHAEHHAAIPVCMCALLAVAIARLRPRVRRVRPKCPTWLNQPGPRPLPPHQAHAGDS